MMLNKEDIKTDPLFSKVRPVMHAVFAIVIAINSTQVAASEGDKVGDEFRVNTFTNQEQQTPNIATNAAGRSVAVWVSRGQPSANNSFEIYAQRFDIQGVKEGDEFLVNIIGDGDNNLPDVSMASNGDFVIVWRRNDTGDNNIYAQRFNADGTKTGNEFSVNTVMADDQEKPSVAMDSEGNFVVVWQGINQILGGYDIFGQKYQADGSFQGGEFRVNAVTNNDQLNPSVAINDNSEFVVTWDSFGQEPVNSGSSTQNGIYAQRFDTFSNKINTEFLVNTETEEEQINPSIAMNTDGVFVIAWDSLDQDGDDYGVYAQRFNANGSAIGNEFLVNTEINQIQQNSAIAINDDGDFIITWESLDQDGGFYGVYAQRFTASGAVQGGEFQVNTEIDSSQRNPAVAIDNNANFIIAWQSSNQVLGGVVDIYAQRYEGKAANTLPTATNESSGGGAFNGLLLFFLLPLAIKKAISRNKNTVKIKTNI